MNGQHQALRQDPAYVAQVLHHSWAALHLKQGRVAICHWLRKADMFSSVCRPAERCFRLAHGLLGPLMTWEGDGTSWWAVHAAVLCQDVEGLKVLLQLGASATQPAPGSATLVELREPGGAVDVERFPLTPLCLCLPVKGKGAAASQTGMFTASGREYDLDCMPQVVRLLKEGGARVHELTRCNLGPLEELAEACGADASPLLRALVEDLGPPDCSTAGWFVAAAATAGRWRLLQRILAAQPRLPDHAVQAIAINAAVAGHCKVMEACLALLPRAQVAGTAHQALKDVLLRGAHKYKGQNAAVVKAIGILLQRGAYINVDYCGPLTPLAMAFKAQWPAAVKLLIVRGADVAVINEQELWHEVATGANPALVVELLSAGCPLPPGGVQQLMAWMNIPSDTAKVVAQQLAAAAAPSPPAESSSSQVAASAAGVAGHAGASSSEPPITAKPLSPAEIAAAALLAEEAQQNQPAAPVAQDAAAKKAAKKQRQAAAKAAAAAAAAAETRQQAGGDAAPAAASAATAAAGDAGAPVAAPVTAAGPPDPVSGPEVDEPSAVTQLPGSSNGATSNSSGNCMEQGATATAAAPQEDFAPISARLLPGAAASSSTTLPEKQDEAPVQTLEQQEHTVAAGGVTPRSLAAQAGPVAKPLSPAELAAVALRAEMEHHRRLSPDAEAKAAQKAAKKQRRAAARAESASASASAAAAAAEGASSSSAGAAPAVGDTHRESSSSSSLPVCGVVQTPASSSNSVEELNGQLSAADAVAEEAANDGVPAAAAAALPAGDAAQVVARQQHNQQHWQQQPTQQQQPPQQLHHQQWLQHQQPQLQREEHVQLSSLQHQTRLGSSQHYKNQCEIQQQLEQQQLEQAVQQQAHMQWGDGSALPAGLPLQHMLPLDAAAADPYVAHMYSDHSYTGSQPPFVAGSAEQAWPLPVYPPGGGLPMSMGMPAMTGHAAGVASSAGAQQELPRQLPGAAGLLLALDTARQAQLVQQQQHQRQQLVMTPAGGGAAAALPGPSNSSSSSAGHQVASTLFVQQSQSNSSSSSSSGSRARSHQQAVGETWQQPAGRGVQGAASGTAATSPPGHPIQARAPAGSPPVAQPAAWSAVAAPPAQQQQGHVPAPPQTARPSGRVGASAGPQARQAASSPQPPTRQQGSAMQVLKASWQKECVVCLDAPSAVLTLPCAHLILCVPCAEGVLQRSAECPMCRTAVETQVMLPHRVLGSKQAGWLQAAYGWREESVCVV